MIPNHEINLVSLIYDRRKNKIKVVLIADGDTPLSLVFQFNVAPGITVLK